MSNFNFRVLNADLAPGVHMAHGVAKPQLHFFDLDEETKVILDSNSLAIVQVSPSVFEMVKKQAEEGEGGSFEGLFFSTASPQFKAFMPQRLNMFVVEVTHGCNLACKYCFVREYYEDQTEKTVTVDQVKRTVDLFFGPKQQLNIGFFGGEPLVAWKRVTEIMEWAEEEQSNRNKALAKEAQQKKAPAKQIEQLLGTRPKFHITTNATLMDEEKAAYLAKRDCSFIVSLDGNEVTHNSMRPMKATGKNSWQSTMNGLSVMHKHGMTNRTTLRSSYTGQGVNLIERMTFLNDLMYRGFGGHVSIEPISLSESPCSEIPSDDKQLAMPSDPQELEALFGREYRAGSDWYIGEIKAGRKPSMHHFDAYLRRLLYTLHSPSECGAGKGYGAISPDGTVFACHREHGSEIGTLDQGIDEGARCKWIENRLYGRKKCPTCPIRWICGGGCRVNSILRMGDIQVPDESECWFKELFIRECLYIMTKLPKDVLIAHIPDNRKQRRR